MQLVMDVTHLGFPSVFQPVLPSVLHLGMTIVRHLVIAFGRSSDLALVAQEFG